MYFCNNYVEYRCFRGYIKLSIQDVDWFWKALLLISLYILTVRDKSEFHARRGKVSYYDAKRRLNDI